MEYGVQPQENQSRSLASRFTPPLPPSATYYPVSMLLLQALVQEATKGFAGRMIPSHVPKPTLRPASFFWPAHPVKLT